MEGCYSVSLGDRPVGKVEVRRKGLYYHFHCRCRLPEDSISRLCVSCGEERESLGILAPLDGGFGLDTKLPAKRFGPGKPVFSIMPNKQKSFGSFAPVYPEEPFSYMADLKRGYLSRQNGELGIQIE